MPLSVKELSDRFEIQDLLYQYADIVDQKNFDQLREVFTTDAHIDLTAYGGSVGDLEYTISYLKQTMIERIHTQHLNANIQITVEGDHALGRVVCFNPQQCKKAQQNQVFLLGLWYVDQYVRTTKGWRIKERLQQKSWTFETPDFLKQSFS